MATHASYNVPPTGLLSLAAELILDIAECIPSQGDLASFLRVNRRLHALLRDTILRQNIRHHNSTALPWAVCNNRVEVVRRMVRFGADIWTTAVPEREIAWLKMDLEGPSYFICWRPRREIPLRRAVEDGNLRLVKILTGEETQKMRATPRGQECMGQSLAVALAKKNEQIARVLINGLGNIDHMIAVDSAERAETALHMSCANGMLRTALYLLQKGANPNAHGDLHYVKNLLATAERQHKLDEDKITILHLLFAHDLQPDEDLRMLGSDHSDARVRWLFSREWVPVPSSQNLFASGEPVVGHLDFEPDGSFPYLACRRSLDERAIELDATWVALRDADYRELLLNIPSAIDERFGTDNSKFSSHDTDVDHFPPLGGRDHKVLTAKADSDAWTNFRRSENDLQRNDDAVSAVVGGTSETVVVKKRRGRKLKWQSVQF